MTRRRAVRQGIAKYRPRDRQRRRLWSVTGAAGTVGPTKGVPTGTSLEFRILGPFELVRSGRVVPLAGGRQRALLAVLLVHGNEVVDTDRLIEALWGTEPPKTARAALQGYVTQLRRLLPPERLATQAGGYSVSVEPGELDLERFEELVAAARTLDPAEAATTLRAALALWRGPALLDFRNEHFAQREVMRAGGAAPRRRRAADRGGPALGRHDELVSELEGLTAEHPFRSGWPDS